MASRFEEQPLLEYADEEDAVTLQLDAPLRDEDWLVRVSATDQCVMSQERLLAELRSSAIFPGTLVWRNGMSEWLAAAEVPALAPALSPRGLARAAMQREDREPTRSKQSIRRRVARGANTPLGAVLAPSGVALLAMLLVSSLLALAGAFDAQGEAQRSQPAFRPPTAWQPAP